MISLHALRQIGRLTVAALLVLGISAPPLYAQSSDKPSPRAEGPAKKKAAQKKPAPKQTGATHNMSSGSMSGYRPDPVTGY